MIFSIAFFLRSRERRMLVFLHRLTAINRQRGCTEAECHSSSTPTSSDRSSIGDSMPDRRNVRDTKPSPVTLHAQSKSSQSEVTNCAQRCLASGGPVVRCLVQAGCVDATSPSSGNRLPAVTKRWASTMCMAFHCKQFQNDRTRWFHCGNAHCGR